MHCRLKSHSFLSGRIFSRCYKTINQIFKNGEADSLIKLICENTVISRNHLTPEISLRLITPECQLWSSKVHESTFKDPFWAFYWPGGQVISRYILDNPKIVENLTVLDVGCGSGACSIAAAKSKAVKVIANDIDNVACISTLMNAELNNVQLDVTSINFLGTDVPYDCIIVGDMFYETEFATKLNSWLLDLHHQNKIVLIGDPGRWAFEKDKLQRLKFLAEYVLPDNVILENSGFSSASVWTFSD